MNLKDIGSCLGLVDLHLTLLCVSILNLLVGMVFCADSVLSFLPVLTMGDLLNNLLLTEEETPRIFIVLPHIIFIVFSLVLLFGVLKNQVQCLYVYLIYGIGRISIATFTLFVLLGNYFGSTNFYIALRSRYMGTFIASLFYNAYSLLLIRWTIIDIAYKRTDEKIKVISGLKRENIPLKKKSLSLDDDAV